MSEVRMQADEREDSLDGADGTTSPLWPWRVGLLAGAVTGAVGTAAVGWSGQLLVITGHLLPWQLLTAAFLIGGAVLGAGGLAVRLTVGLLGVVVVAAGLVWSGAHSLRDVTLSPGGAEDCRVVVRESTRLHGYTGDVFVRHGQWGVANRVATYIAPDPTGAADFGSYELSWQGVDGRLAIGYLMNGGERWTAFHCG